MEDIVSGKCWLFGDEIPVDGGIMDLRFLVEQVHDPVELGKHVLERLNPEFPKLAQPGDLVIAGRRFGHGNPHIQGFIGMKGLGVSVLAESIPRGAVRCSVNAGIYFLPRCPGIAKITHPGDRLKVNFKTGEIRNLTTGGSLKVAPLPETLLEIIRAGGGKAYLRRMISPSNPTPASQRI
jgi:3-isopropylmalate/(R)-2-methylmalate dehydratase small subunit